VDLDKVRDRQGRFRVSDRHGAFERQDIRRNGPRGPFGRPWINECAGEVQLADGEPFDFG
jgi:hypothetical protein